jgi:broad specificity phosphatase PhoE
VKKLIVYQVRHGSTADWMKRIYQVGNTPLSARGIMQANKLAQRFKNIPVDVIISSKILRAEQTARIVAHAKGKRIQFWDGIHEVVRPTKIWGRSKHEPEVAAIMEAVYAAMDTDARVLDEETFSEFRQRGISFVRRLENLKVQSVLVVSHGHIIRMATAVMTHGDSVSASQFREVEKKALENTSVTICVFDRKKRAWEIEEWEGLEHFQREFDPFT